MGGGGGVGKLECGRIGGYGYLSLWEVRKENSLAGNNKKCNKLCNIAKHFAIEKGKRVGSH